MDKSCIDDLISELNKETSKNMNESCIDDLISELNKETLKNEVKYWNVDIIS